VEQSQENITKKNGNLTRYHNTSKKWLSELDFVLVEHHFIKELIHTHFLEICQENLIDEISEKQKEIENMTSKINILILEIYTHEKRISLLLDNNQPVGLKLIHENHKLIQSRFNQLVEMNKLIKSIIFDIIKDIMIQYKLKKNIENSITQSKAS